MNLHLGTTILALMMPIKGTSSGINMVEMSVDQSLSSSRGNRKLERQGKLSDEHEEWKAVSTRKAKATKGAEGAGAKVPKSSAKGKKSKKNKSKSVTNGKGAKASKKGAGNGNTIYLSPGDSIQEALDNASAGTIFKLSPGDYIDQTNTLYGLRVSQPNIKLIAIADDSNTSNTATRILQYGSQEVGVYAAPEGCEFTASECDSILSSFSIEGIVVEGFPANGIQTRFVDGFEFRNCKSVNNLRNGLYPTLSMNGVIQGCVSYGSLDSGLWVAGSRQVRVVANEIYDSVTGLEVTVSRDLYIANNSVHDNVAGIGMYHANMAGTRPNSPPYNNWMFENNHVYNNNRENNAPEGSFQAGLPVGIGILMIGIRGQTVRNNTIEGNGAAGLALAGFCSVQGFAFQNDCAGSNAPSDGDPSANDNFVIGNLFHQNGDVGLPGLGLPGSDIIYIQSQQEFLKPDGNCFQNNTNFDGEEASSFALDSFSMSPISLPTDGCMVAN